MRDRYRFRVSRAWLWPVLMGTLLVIVLAAGASAAIETNTVHTFWRGVWRSISLVTTVGFIGEPPRTWEGAALSVGLMVLGFVLLAMVSASLAALFVRDEERPHVQRDEALAQATLATLERVESRLSRVETQLAQHPPKRAEPE